MAGRAKSKPDGVAVAEGPFGKPSVIVHPKENGGSGISPESMVSKPLEAGYVEPMQRSNPEYLAKLATEKAGQVQEQKEREAAKVADPRKAFGYGLVPQVFGASPNSPQAKTHRIY